ncbi:hypothetical protein HMSSN036_51100 [Paenibacillus macerans]|nr:hypothetical protein HMSSN036_51100 [Paenibacillus macerans]
MKLIVLFGPQAVGKMTVGQELAKITGLKLFHNHMTIDLVSHFFDYGTPAGKDWSACSAGKYLQKCRKASFRG